MKEIIFITRIQYLNCLRSASHRSFARKFWKLFLELNPELSTLRTLKQSKKWWTRNFSLVSSLKIHPVYLSQNYEGLWQKKFDDHEAIMLSKMKDRPHWQASCVELLVYPFGLTVNTRESTPEKDDVIVYLEEIRAFVKNKRACVPPCFDHTQGRFTNLDEKARAAEQKLKQLRSFQQRTAARMRV